MLLRLSAIRIARKNPAVNYVYMHTRGLCAVLKSFMLAKQQMMSNPFRMGSGIFLGPVGLSVLLVGRSSLP